MLNLIAAAGFFLALHLLVSGTSLRGRIVAVTGETPYLGLFSLASIGGIVWLCLAYNATDAVPNRLYWVAPDWLIHLAPAVMLVAFLFALIGLTTPNPTAVKAEALLGKPDAVRGILRITRHPFLWSVILWSGLHLALNGDQASVIFFGSYLLLAALGTLSIDAKRRLKLAEQWKAFAVQTSNLPFAAIFAGRNKLALGELGLWRILLGLLAFGGMFYAHLWLFGVSPVPGWAPY
ncbi:MAG: NnrU family protein [Parvibaculaceae bacterium]